MGSLYGQLPEWEVPVDGVVVDGVVAVAVGVVVVDDPDAALAIAAPPPAIAPAAPSATSATRNLRNRFKAPSPPLGSLAMSCQ